MRSGLWEADRSSLRWLSPTYPSDAPGKPAPLPLVRATWFQEQSGGGMSGRKPDLLPIGEPLAELLNSTAAKAPWTSPVRAGREVKLEGPGLPSGLRALFVSESEAWLVSEFMALRLNETMNALNSLARAAGVVSESPSSPTSSELPPMPVAQRLRHGFSEALAAPLSEEAQADESVAAQGPVTHLVLTTHGIGHSLDFVEHGSDARTLGESIRRLEASGGSASSGRLLVLPVQWRKGLSVTGDPGTLDSLLSDAPAIRPMRVVLNALVSDVLRYHDAANQAAMTGALAGAANDVFARFMRRHPGFKGPVSLVAHSLGSVLAFDLLCSEQADGRLPSFPSPPPAGEGEGEAALRAEIAALRAALRDAEERARSPQPSLPASPVRVAALAFPVDTLVMLGSPLGLFVTLRGEEGLTRPAQRLRCRRMVNIMHPYDPVGYRVEPAAYPPALAVAAPSAGGPPPTPAEVPFVKGGRRIQTDLADRASYAASALRSFSLSSVVKDRVSAVAAAMAGTSSPSAAATEAAGPPAADAAAMEGASARAGELLRRLSGGGGGPVPAEDWQAGSGRVDFQLQTADINPFLSVLTAHTTYWACQDTALMTLRAVRSADPPTDVAG